MKYLNWLKIQKCYPYPLIFESVEKRMDFCKKKKFRENYTSYRPEKWIDYAHHHSPQSIRFVVWHPTYFFQYLFLRSIFTHFYHIFDPLWFVQVNGENFQFQNFVFLTSELKSTLIFSLENIIFYILANFFFFTPNVHKTRVRSWTVSYAMVSLQAILFLKKCLL